MAKVTVFHKVNSEVTTFNIVVLKKEDYIKLHKKYH